MLMKKWVTLEGDVIEKMVMFLALMEECKKLSLQEKNVNGKSFKDIAFVLCKRAVSLKLRGSLYKSRVRSAFKLWCWILGFEKRR